MDSATNDATVWVTLLVLGDGAVAVLLSFILVCCFCKHRDRVRYYLNMEFERCCLFTCVALLVVLMLSIAFNIVNIGICLVGLGSPCQALNGIYFSLAVVLLFLYVVCLIACSCTCDQWRYRRNSRIRHRRFAVSYEDVPTSVLTRPELYDSQDFSHSDNQGIPFMARELHNYEGRSSREENESVIDNRLLDHILPEYSSETPLPEPHQPKPRQPEPRQPEPRQPEPCQPETPLPEPPLPEPREPECHLLELHLTEFCQTVQPLTQSCQPEPHQHELRQSGPHLPHQEIRNPSTEFVCSLLDVSVPKYIAQTCFVLGDVHTLPITHQGGTFPLHPFGPCGGEQQVECCATLEAPPGVVGSGVTVSVHYAIILDGPFKFPEEWERTSVVLYIDCPDSRFLIERLTVNLHHWAVSSETSRMCFMKSSHLLQKGQTKFTFKCHANAIPSQPNVASVYLKDHFCLVCVAAASDVMVMSRYYGILLSDPLKDRVEKFWLCITYAVPSWVEAVAEYYRRREGSEGCCEIPEYEEMQISYGNKVKVDMENESGLGWTLSVTKKEALLSDMESLSRYTSCTQKEKAVRIGCYPPSVKFRVTYDTVPSPETHKPITKLARLSSESGDTISLSFMVQEEKAKDPMVPSDAITDVNMLSNGHVPGLWTETTDSFQDDSNLGEPSKPLTVQHLMPYINDLADKVVSISGWLGMGEELEVIKRTLGMITPREHLQELLKKWLEDTERPTAPHTWEYFVRVVRGVRKGHVADRIVEDVFKDKGPPSDLVALEKRVVSKMADNWYQFGLHLGLSEDTLKAAGDFRLDNSTRCLITFRHWMEEVGPIENKIDKIEQAMKEVMKITGSEVSSKMSTCERQQGGKYSLSNEVIAYWAKKMADKWFKFGIALGSSEQDLQSIKNLNDTGDSDSNEVCCSVMLYHWMENGDQREKTHERLLQAAKEANPLVVTNGMCPEPPPYSESQTSDLEIPPIVLDT